MELDYCVDWLGLELDWIALGLDRIAIEVAVAAVITLVDWFCTGIYYSSKPSGCVGKYSCQLYLEISACGGATKL